jgi:hypothetical protein
VTGPLLYLQASTATLYSCSLLKCKLNEHFKWAYKVFLFSKAKETHLGPTQPLRIPRKSGSLSMKLCSHGVKLSALFKDDVCTASVTHEWTSTEQRWNDNDERKSYRNILLAKPLFNTNLTGNGWDWTHASAVSGTTAESWRLLLNSTHLQTASVV